MKYDVVSFGSAVLDAFVSSPDIKIIESDEFFTKKALAVAYGIKSEVERFLLASGGGGTNTAAGFARLGLKTAIVARCGWDFAGKMIREELKKEKVDDTFLVQLEGEGTDYSTILRAPDGGRTILVYRGGTKLDESVIDVKSVNSFWFYVASLEGNVSLLEKILDHAQENHIKVVLNPGRKELDNREDLLKQARRADYLVLNREEAARFVDCTIVDETLFKKISILFEKTIVLVTEAEKGVNVIIPKTGHFFSESFKVEMVDATGAGDAFSAGFVGGLALNFDLQKAVKLGSANGASVVGKLGCKPGLLRKEEVDSWMEKEVEYVKKDEVE